MQLNLQKMQAKHGEKHGFFRWFDDTFDRITGRYVHGVEWIMRNWLVSFGIFAGVIVALLVLFRVLPGAFIPQEDQGYIFVPYALPDSASLDRTGEVGRQASDFMQRHEAVANVSQVDGFSLLDSQNKSNFGLLFVALKNYEERKGQAYIHPKYHQWVANLALDINTRVSAP